jgi:hypothetical protein
MNSATLTKPRFETEQKVRFVGGYGTIKSYRPDSGSWLYLIEMEMGPKPEMGRVGNETKIFLSECDLDLLAKKSRDRNLCHN